MSDKVKLQGQVSADVPPETIEFKKKPDGQPDLDQPVASTPGRKPTLRDALMLKRGGLVMEIKVVDDLLALIDGGTISEEQAYTISLAMRR